MQTIFKNKTFKKANDSVKSNTTGENIVKTL